uniref:Uncharacterized protein n=1 Tax=Arundo donax TaxID=35708 RepID=A0A0A9AB53_ARUDO
MTRKKKYPISQDHYRQLGEKTAPRPAAAENFATCSISLTYLQLISIFFLNPLSICPT